MLRRSTKAIKILVYSLSKTYHPKGLCQAWRGLEEEWEGLGGRREARREWIGEENKGLKGWSLVSIYRQKFGPVQGCWEGTLALCSVKPDHGKSEKLDHVNVTAEPNCMQRFVSGLGARALGWQLCIRTRKREGKISNLGVRALCQYLCALTRILISKLAGARVPGGCPYA